MRITFAFCIGLKYNESKVGAYMSLNIDSNGAISSALSGMATNARSMNRAADNIAKMNLSMPKSSNLSSSSYQYNQQGLLNSATLSPGMTDNLVNFMQSSNLYTANAKVVNAVDSAVGSALNVLV